MLGGLLFLIAYRCLFGVLAQRIAELRSFDKGFAWGFWLGLIGLYVIAFRRAEEQPAVAPSRRARWLCQQCGAYNPAGAQACMSCQARREFRRPKLECPNCHASNNASNHTCFACGRELV